MAKALSSYAADLELARRCAAGDRKAQEDFFGRYQRRMMAVCVRYMGGKEQAADVFQEAYIRAYRLMATYRAEGPLEAWLRRIVVSTALNELKKRKMVWLEDQPEGFVLSPVFNTAQQHLQEADLLQLVASLPPGYRTVFNLYVLEGFDHREIGEMLGISESTSRTQLLKARMLLQKKIVHADPQAAPAIKKMRS